MKKKYWAILILSLIAIAVLVIYANQPYFPLAPIVTPHNKLPHPHFAATTPPSATMATSSPVQVDTSGWKTYANNIYGFSLRYPASLKVQTDPYNPAMVSLNPLNQVSDDSESEGFSTIVLDASNNVKQASPGDLLKASIGDARCNSDPVSETIGVFSALESMSDSKCVEFPQNHFPQSRYVVIAFKDRAIFSSIINQPLADQILSTLNFTDPSNKIVTNGEISYAVNDNLFDVTTKQFKISDVFSADYLENYSSGCYGQTHSLSYYQTLLSKFSFGDEGTLYDFNFKGPQQDSGNIYEITVIPNKLGYKTIDQFNADFGLCDAGESLYPSQVNDNYLMFEPACGTGASEIGCDAIQNFAEYSINLNK